MANEEFMNEETLKRVDAKKVMSSKEQYKPLAEECDKGIEHMSFEKVPFCGACLREEFERLKHSNKYNFLRGYLFQQVVPSWKDYSGEELFNYLGYNEDKDHKTRLVVSRTYNFVCKKRGHGVSICVESDVVNPHEKKSKVVRGVKK